MPDEETEATEEEQVDEGPEGLLASSSEKMWPNRQEDEQDMEMEPVVMSPPGYGSPDPKTQEGILVPVDESPLDIAEDYGTVAVASQGADDEGAEDEGEESDAPATSATRAEWDDYARSKGVDPEQFSSKDDLIAALS
jgi:hypothetical protein